jgi:hypothetical protein
MQLREMLALLLQELVDQLREANLLDSMCTVTAYPGNAVPVDYAGGDECGGMAWVRHVSSNPTVQFPSADVSVDNCYSTLAHIIEVGIIRPAPIPESDGSTVDLPDAIEHLNSALDLADDMMVMQKAIARAAKSIDFVILGSYAPVGPEGGAVGGTWSLTVGEDDDGS